MMCGDSQSQGLAEWLLALGCRENVGDSSLHKLNTPKMRSVWRHLQAHVGSAHKVNLIRKNVLLDSLEGENIRVGQFQNLKLDSVDQLNKMKKIIKVEENKDVTREEIVMIDQKLYNENSTLLHKISVEKLERHDLNEIDDKTIMLELKYAKLLNDCKQVDDTKETIAYLKNPKTAISQNELNRQKSTVFRYVKNYRYPSKDTEDESEYLSEMMSSILKFKPSCILDAITQNAKDALILLNSMVDSLASVEDSYFSKQKVTFHENLKDLKILVIRNEQRICQCLERISSEKYKLQDEITQLTEAMKNEVESSYLGKELPENFGDYMIEGGRSLSNNKYIRQRLVGFLEKVQQVSENNKICEEANHLTPDIVDFEPLEILKQSVQSLCAEEEESCKKNQKKVNGVNMVVSEVYRSVIDSHKLSEFQDESSLIAADFKTETCQMHKQNINSCEFAEMISKEVQMFQRTPMVAVNRKWEKSKEKLGVVSAQTFSGNDYLLNFLLQAEEKNIVVNVLLKYLWSLSNSHNFSVS